MHSLIAFVHARPILETLNLFVTHFCGHPSIGSDNGFGTNNEHLATMLAKTFDAFEVDNYPIHA